MSKPRCSHPVAEFDDLMRTALFDLDGTLVDTLPDLAASLNRVLGAAGLAPLETPAVARMVGDGVAVLVARALAARGHGPDPDIFAAFEADYLAQVAVASRPYPGVAEMLAALSGNGWRLAICTNKPEVAARKLLQSVGLLSSFSSVAGGDSFAARKPDPGHLLATLQAAGGERARAVMVGDHANDIAAARAAGVASVFVLWGYGAATMAGNAPVASVVSDLPALLDALVPPLAPEPAPTTLERHPQAPRP